MMRIKFTASFLAALLFSFVFPNLNLCFCTAEEKMPYVLVGIDVAYRDYAQIEKLVIETKGYTNLFVLGCTGITQNMTELDMTCQYLYDEGFFFIIYQNTPLGFNRRNETLDPQLFNWPLSAEERGRNRFLGFYVYDEVGGRQLDLYENWVTVEQANNYTDAGAKFSQGINRVLDWYTGYYSNITDFPLFTSDYALYWFDYKAGYDVLLAQLGWNYSRQLNIALCRGAATVQNKDWGVIITWTYTEPPYLESGAEMYKDMVLAYENGAKYVVVFDSNDGWTAGTLQPEHLEVLKQFWQFVQANPRNKNSLGDRVAYVLPKDYAYGFRGPNDSIWGLWEADELTIPICLSLNWQLEHFGKNLDIIYDDGLTHENSATYSSLIYWNSDTGILNATKPSASPPMLTLSPSPHQPPSQLPSLGIYSPFLTTNPLIEIAVGISAILILAYVAKNDGKKASK